MTALGLDTSVIVRFLAGEPEQAAERARERISEALQAGHELVVSDLAVVESYYVLHKIYGIPRKAALKALLEFFRQPGFRGETGGVAAQALAEAAASARPGLADRMLLLGYRRECRQVLTLDQAFGKQDGAEFLG
jgi:predicted nucleic acid-binding protein